MQERKPRSGEDYSNNSEPTNPTTEIQVADSCDRQSQSLANTPSLIEKIAHKYNVDPAKMLPALRATVFKTAVPATNEQLMALLVVADQYNLNPWTKEIYAFPDKRGGIVPVVGVDGWLQMINSHPAYDGMDVICSEDIDDKRGNQTCSKSIRCIIYRKDRKHPVSIEEYLDECYRESVPWRTHTRRMLRHKAIIQCARIAFSFSGIYDPDEAERIIEGEVIHLAVPEALPPTREFIKWYEEQITLLQMAPDVMILNRTYNLSRERIQVEGSKEHLYDFDKTKQEAEFEFAKQQGVSA